MKKHRSLDEILAELKERREFNAEIETAVSIRKLIEELAIERATTAKAEGLPLREQNIKLQIKRIEHEFRQRKELNNLIYRKEEVKYVHNEQIKIEKEKTKRTKKLLEKMFIKYDGEEATNLLKIIKKDRQYKMIESLKRIKAMSEIMEKNEWQACFIVATLQSKYSRNSKKWNNEMLTPKEANEHGTELWKIARRRIAKKLKAGTDFLAIRTVEPTKCACPHYNFVFIAELENLKIIKKIITKVFLIEENPNEYGAKENRLNINVSTGTEACDKIASYAAKYALKTFLEEHKTETQQFEAEAAKAWRACWKIRGISFCGFAKIGIWRAARKETRATKKDGTKIKRRENTIFNKLALEKDFVKFHFEYIKQKKNVKPIRVTKKDCYGELIKETIGYKVNNKLIQIKMEKARVFFGNQGGVALDESKPRGAAGAKGREYSPPRRKNRLLRLCMFAKKDKKVTNIRIYIKKLIQHRKKGAENRRKWSYKRKRPRNRQNLAQ